MIHVNLEKIKLSLDTQGTRTFQLVQVQCRLFKVESRDINIKGDDTLKRTALERLIFSYRRMKLQEKKKKK